MGHNNNNCPLTRGEIVKKKNVGDTIRKQKCITVLNYKIPGWQATVALLPVFSRNCMHDL